MNTVLADTAEDNTSLSIEQERRLEEDIKATKDPQNLVDHKVTLKKMNKWLKNKME